MKRKLFVAALAMVGGCDHHFGIGALGPHAEDAVTGRDAGSFSVDLGADTQTSSVSGTDAQSLLAEDAGVELPPDNAADAGVGLPPDNTADAGVFGRLAPGITTWTGYIDGYQFPSGSNAIRFALGIGQVTGMVVLGSGPPLPPATDPNVGYPPEYHPANGVYWAEGFAYSIVYGEAAPWSLQFAIMNGELWSGWCAEQTPVAGSSMCLPNWPGDHIIGTNGSPDQCYQQDPANGRKTVVDCGKYDLCITSAVCACSAPACVVNQNSGQQAIFFLAIPDNSTTATGTVSGIAGTVAAVHFTQDP
jgi:hypothetical protein